MITKDEFLAILKKGGADVAELEPELGNFNECVAVAQKVQMAMPGIGFASVNKRLNCFIAVCRHLDAIIDDAEIDLTGSQIVLNILRLKDRKFRKAIAMFDIRGRRYGPRDRSELPRSAREYLAGIEYVR